MLELDNSTKQLISYKPFREMMQKRMLDIDQLLMAMDTIKPLNYSVTNILEIGVVMKEFYMLHTSETYHKTMLYAFGMTGYLQCIYALTKNSKIHYCKLSNNQTTMKKVYYPSLKNNPNAIKNNVDLNVKINR